MKVQKKVKMNKGFSMIELIVAFAILGIIVTVVSYMMTSSSKTYRKLSVESQLQSEAQLVANSISELAIDSMDAGNTLETASFKSDVDNSVNDTIVLLSKIKNNSIRYQIVHNATSKELYIVESKFDDSTKTYEAGTQSLLGQNIEAISVDLSRVKKDNILSFDLTYKRDGRSFTGNYQVLMRNRAYADPDTLIGDPSESRMIMLDISPKIVYMDIKNGEAVQYYRETLSAEPTTINPDNNSIEFMATPSFVGTPGSLDSTWSMQNQDTKIFTLSASEGQKSNLRWSLPLGYAFKDTPYTEFKVIAEKESFKKAASIRLRMVKSIDISAQKGITGWKNEYSSSVYAGHKAADAEGYAQPNGTVTVYANVNSTNVKTALKWKLYKRGYEGLGSWEECTDSAFGKVLNSETTGYSNIITLGKNATNSIEFKLEAISVFDESVTDEYIFGVVPTRSGSGGGFYSRGYRTNMGDFFKENPILQGGGSERNKVVAKILDIDFGTGSNYDFNVDQAFKWDVDAQTLYIDYETFQYTGAQRKAFYEPFVITMNIRYIDIDGHEQYYEGYHYQIKGVKVSAIASDTICVKPGTSGTIDVKTSYYNIKDRKLIGIYAQEYGGTDFTDNLNREGHENTDKYITVKAASEYGDINTFVDNMTYSIYAKKSNNAIYATDPITVRVTIDDFYNVSNHEANSYKDYKIYIANVENQDVFLPVPDSKTGWLASVPTSEASAATVTGINTSGSVVTGKVYKDGQKTKCKYGAHTYVYDPTYKYWKELY